LAEEEALGEGEAREEELAGERRMEGDGMAFTRNLEREEMMAHQVLVLYVVSDCSEDHSVLYTYIHCTAIGVVVVELVHVINLRNQLTSEVFRTPQSQASVTPPLVQVPIFINST